MGAAAEEPDPAGGRPADQQRRHRRRRAGRHARPTQDESRRPRRRRPWCWTDAITAAKSRAGTRRCSSDAVRHGRNRVCSVVAGGRSPLHWSSRFPAGPRFSSSDPPRLDSHGCPVGARVRTASPGGSLTRKGISGRRSTLPQLDTNPTGGSRRRSADRSEQHRSTRSKLRRRRWSVPDDELPSPAEDVDLIDVESVDAVQRRRRRSVEVNVGRRHRGRGRSRPTTSRTTTKRTRRTPPSPRRSPARQGGGAGGRSPRSSPGTTRRSPRRSSRPARTPSSPPPPTPSARTSSRSARSRCSTPRRRSTSPSGSRPACTPPSGCGRARRPANG